MPVFGQIIWTTRNKTWFEMLNTLRAFFNFLGKRNILLGLRIHSQQTFRTSLINNFQTFWEQSTYQSSNDLIILLWTTKMGVTFKWYELAKWITRSHIFLWESTGKNAMMHIESEAQERRKCYLLSIPLCITLPSC